MAQQFDKNMVVNTTLDLPDVKFYDIDQSPIRLYGIWREGESYRRLPQEVANTVSRGISKRCATTAGGRIRFVTDSLYVAIKVEYGECELSGKIPHTAMAGFDLYADGFYQGQYILPSKFSGEDFESVVNIRGERKKRLVTINTPLYSELKHVYIGLSNDAEISHAPDYTYEKPVIFYGSSITHGGVHPVPAQPTSRGLPASLIQTSVVSALVVSPKASSLWLSILRSKKCQHLFTITTTTHRTLTTFVKLMSECLR